MLESTHSSTSSSLDSLPNTGEIFCDDSASLIISIFCLSFWLYSKRFLLAVPPTSIASCSSFRFKSWRKLCPVCKVSTRSPNAIVNLAPTFGSASPYIMRALPMVLPQPVDAILTPKNPSVWVACCNDFASL